MHYVPFPKDPQVLIGAAYEGGFYGGTVVIDHKLHAVIWAPKHLGEISMPWLSKPAPVPGARSCSDSMANTVAMEKAGSKLARWALNLDIGGHGDWCLPARDVLELAYRHLKPSTYKTGAWFRDGDNPSSLPVGYPYSLSDTPIVQTTEQAFQEGGPQAFETEWYWSSTQYSDSTAWNQNFHYGYQNNYIKSVEARARAVRLIQITT